MVKEKNQGCHTQAGGLVEALVGDRHSPEWSQKSHHVLFKRETAVSTAPVRSGF